MAALVAFFFCGFFGKHLLGKHGVASLAEADGEVEAKFRRLRQSCVRNFSFAVGQITVEILFPFLGGPEAFVLTDFIVFKDCSNVLNRVSGVKQRISADGALSLPALYAFGNVIILVLLLKALGQPEMM